MDPEFERECHTMLAGGPSFLADQLKVRALVRKQWRGDGGALLDSHWLTVSVIASLTSRKNGVPSLDGRLSLTASFVQGIDACETCIAEGLYVQAAALVRQELETIAAIRELCADKREDGKTPNIKHLPHLGKIYGDLSTLAHVSDQNWLRSTISRQLSTDVTGASISPRYQPKLARLLYGWHVTLLILVAMEIATILTELYGGSGFLAMEEKMLVRGFSILVDEGVLVPHLPRR